MKRKENNCFVFENKQQKKGKEMYTKKRKRFSKKYPKKTWNQRSNSALKKATFLGKKKGKKKKSKKREKDSLYAHRPYNLYKEEKEEEDTFSKNRTVINMNIFPEHFFGIFFSREVFSSCSFCFDLCIFGKFFSQPPWEGNKCLILRWHFWIFFPDSFHENFLSHWYGDFDCNFNFDFLGNMG